MFDRTNLQGNILRPYTHPLFRCVFIEVTDAARARCWLEQLTAAVTSAEDWIAKPETTVNVLLTTCGLAALGLPERLLQSFPAEFRAGMASRADLLGDTGVAAPAHWDGGLGTDAIHLMVSIYGLTPTALVDRLAWLDQLIATTGGVRIVSWQDAARLPTVREHFGYTDGIGQPAIEGNDLPAQPGQGNPTKGNNWETIKAGEFILGYPDEEQALPPAPLPEALGHESSYLVYRKLQQHVGVFRQFLRAQAEHYPGGEEQLAAKIIGRWRDGTPVELSPDHPDPDLARDPARNNNFRYTEDQRGLRCPVGAHIRRANPRDAFGFGEKLANRHRILRRGLPYGAPLPEGELAEDGIDRGVIFMGLNASISRQFEFIQSQWFNDGNLFGLGDDRDPILGNREGLAKLTINGQPPYFLAPLPRFVTMRGGEYFFVPSLRGLRYLAAGSYTR